MKKIARFILLLCMIAFPLVTTACGDPYKGMKIEIDKSSIVIYLGQTPNNEVNVIATVSGSKKVCEAVFSSTSNKIYITTKYLGDGRTLATIKGLEPCLDSEIKVQSKENNKITYFNVSVVQPITAIQVKEDAKTYGMFDEITGNTNTEFMLSSSMFEFSPKNTTQTDLSYELAENYNPDDVTLTNNILKVKNSNNVQNIKLRAISTADQTVFVNFDYTILPSIQSEIKIDNADYSPESTSLSFVKNNLDKAKHDISFTVNQISGYPIKVTPILNTDTVVLTNSSVSSSNSSSGILSTYTYTLSAGMVGVTQNIKFLASYESYPQVSSVLLQLGAETFEEIKSILVYKENNQNEILENELQIYNQYTSDVPGLKLIFEAYPTSIPDKNKKLLVNLNELQDDFDFFDVNKNVIEKVENLYEISSGSFVYIRAKSVNEANNTILKIISKDYPEVSKEINLIRQVGVNNLKFLVDEQEINNIMLTTNNTMSISVTLKVNEKADVSSVQIVQTGNSFAYNLDRTQGVLTVSSVENAPDEEGYLTFTFDNYYTQRLPIECFKQLTENIVKVTTESSLENSAVSVYKKNTDNSVNTVIFKNGNSIKLNIDTKNAFVSKVNYLYKDFELEEDYQAFTKENASTSSSNITIFDGYLVANGVGYTKIFVLLEGYKLNEGKKETTLIEKSFYVEIYNPLVSLEFDKYQLSLYSKNSLGAYDSNYYESTVGIKINGETKPDNLNYVVEYDKNKNDNEYFKIELVDENTKISATALKFDENKSQINFIVSVKEKFGLVDSFGVNLQKSLTIKISEAVKLDNVDVVNVSENGIYIDLTTSFNKVFQIITKTYPLNALNSNLIYTFVPDIDTNSSILSVDNQGLITLSDNKIGGSGYIKIVPEDCYIKDENGNTVESERIEKLVKFVRIFIADGKSEKTAKRIYDIAEIKTNPTLHYSLMKNVILYSDLLTEDFSGGLYGNLNGSGEIVTITLKNCSLFNILTSTSVIKNLSIIGSSANSGFVCSENNGIIENVSIDADLSEGLYKSSVLSSVNSNVGGIAGVNKGTIKNCQVSATIITTGNAGGIAGVNAGKIIDSKFLAYVYQLNPDVKGYNYISATNIGAIAVENKENAIIQNSSAVIYSEQQDVEGQVFKNGTLINLAPIEIVAPENIDFNNVYLQNTVNSIKEINARSILFYYETEGEVLSSEEKNVVNSWNTIELKTLFTNFNSNSLILASNNLVTVNSSSLIINGVGEVVLTLFNKTNFEQSKTINVLITYPINDFSLIYDGITIENNTTLKVKLGTTITFKTAIQNQRIAVNRSLKLKLDSDLRVNNLKLGVYNAVIQNEYDIDFKLNFDTFVTSKANYNEVLAQNNTKVKVSTYKGAELISVNNTSISFEPLYSGNLFVDMITDISDDYITVQIKDSQGEIVYDYSDYESKDYIFELFIQEQNQNLTEGKYKKSYNIELYVKENYKNNDFDENGYQIYINSTSLSVNNNKTLLKIVDLKIKKQEIKRVEFLHYLLENESRKDFIDGYSSEPVSTVTPGDIGLLNISLFPLYTKFDYITITSPIVNDQQLSLRLLQKDENDKLIPANINLFTKIDNGFSLSYSTIANYYSVNNINGNSKNLGNFYVKTIVSSEVNIDTVFNVIVSIHSSEKTENFTYNLITRYLQKPTIFINEDTKNTYVAKNTLNDIQVYVPKNQAFNVRDVYILPVDENTYFEDWEVDYSSSNIYDIYKSKIHFGIHEEYQVLANVSWIINNKLQVKTEVVNIYTLDFIINSQNNHLAVDSQDKYYISSYIEITTILDFNLNIVYSNENINQVNKFLKNNYYVANYNNQNTYMLAGDYIVNYFDDINYKTLRNDDIINPLRNLSVINGNEITPVYNYVKNTINEFDNIKFEVNEEDGKIRIIGKSTGIINLRYSIKVKMPNGEMRNIEFDFIVEVKVYTDEDTPRVIATAQDFINIQNEEEQQDYILMNDITLENYTPFNTDKIASLDGNNKTIYIKSFEVTEESNSVSFALFGQVSSQTLLKNLRVNYNTLNHIQLDNSIVNNMQIAGLAITNNGLITNCEIVSFATSSADLNTTTGLIVDLKFESTNINSIIAGFVINNTATGSITNSRVGGDTVQIVSNNETVKLLEQKPFKISGQGDIAGFVYENSGLISSSYVKNTFIENKTAQNYDSLTSGFVVYNRAGHINSSYVKGVANSSTEIHISKLGIDTLGISAGFVYQNSAKISDCYSNIKLTNNNNVGRASAGFVYNNDKNGSVFRCYSASLIKNATTTQMNFSGVDNNQEYLNEGIIENSYYYDDNVKYNENGEQENTSIEEYFDTPAIRVDNVNNKELYYGFSFNYNDNQNGIWKITNQGPELISANEIAISSRYLVMIDDEKYVLPYVSGYDYGSIQNPILIRTAQEFNEFFGNSERTPIQNYYNTTDKTVFGSYRLINDLDFSEFSSSSILNSSLMTLTAVKSNNDVVVSAGMLDGNGFTISNLTMTSNSSITDSFGLFKEIKDDAIIKNLNISVGKVDEYSNVYGITAGDTACVGVLAGKLTNASISNINLSAVAKGVTVAGQNLVGGVVGKVYNPINITNISVNNLSVIAYQTNVKNYVATLKDTNYSYAGGLFGIISNDAKNPISQNDVKEFTPEYKTFKVFGAPLIEGAISGGIAGYIGKGIHIQDLHYIFESEDSKQKIIAYEGGYAGGIVGLLEGVINQARSEYSDTIQAQIESNVTNYYVSNFALAGDKEIFVKSDYAPKYVGGLVGLIKEEGEIFRSYSKLNVCNSQAKYVGGLAGYAENFTASECYTTGDVFGAEYVGGLVGDFDFNITLNNVNALNIWDKYTLNILTSGSVKFGTITGGDIRTDLAYNATFQTVNTIKNIDNSTNYLNVCSNNNDINIEEIDNKTFTYNETRQNVIDFSDYAFKISDANFNANKWEKGKNDLFLDMRFIVKNNVFFINVAEDLQLIKKYPNATFIINDMVDCRTFSINNQSFQIQYFSGVLKGRDIDKEYGFKNLNLKNPLFNNVVNATFSNFTIQDTLGGTTETNALLVDTAKGLNANSLTIKNYKLFSNDNENVGLVVANILSGKTNFENLTLIENKITVNSVNKKGLYAGLVFGNSSGTVSLKNLNLVNLSKEATANSNNIEIAELSQACKNDLFVGILGGYTNSLQIDNPEAKDEFGKDKTNLISGSVNVKSAKNNVYSGLVGKASIVTTNNVQITENIKVLAESKNAFVGGIAGNINGVLNCINECKITSTNLEATATKSSLGGLVGEFKGNKFLGNSTNYVIVDNNVVITANGKNTDIGGLVGNFEIANISSNETINFSTTYSRPNIKIATQGDISVGGLFGTLKNDSEHTTTIKDAYFDGLIYKSDNKPNTLINVGGLIGSASANTENSIILNNCSSYGDIKISPDKIIKNNDLKIDYIYTSAYVGGLVGYANNVQLENNKSLTSIFNKYGNYVYKNSDSSILALIGKYENCNFVKNGEIDTNEFCEQINLTSDSVGTNKLFKEFTPLTYTWLLEGEKAKPIDVTSFAYQNGFKSLNNNRITYYSIFSISGEETVDLKLEIPFENNVFIVGNGIIVKSKQVLNQGIFDKIQSNSVISGVSIRNLEMYTGEYNYVGTLANENDGYIYLCNVIGKFNQNKVSMNSIFGLAINQLSGFINKNNGFISDCFSHIDISSKAKEVAGFVRTNDGVIQNAYSAGSIQNATESVMAFANGYLYDCYTIVQAYNESLNSLNNISIFGNENYTINCWYDKLATQISVKSSLEKNTDDVSLNYDMGNTISYDAIFSGNKINKWTNNIDTNYGYPAFPQKYMQVSTTKFDEVGDANTYVVPNLGKLQQIKKDKNYALGYNLDGGKLNGYSFKQIVDTFTGKFDGKAKTISNLNIQGGIWNETQGEISNFTLRNCTPETNGGLITDTISSGTIGDIIISYNHDFTFENIYTFGAIAGTMKGGTISNCCINGETSKGGVYNQLKFLCNTSDDIIIGGLIGIADGESNVENCHSRIDIKVITTNNNDYDGTLYVGGISGISYTKENPNYNNGIMGSEQYLYVSYNTVSNYGNIQGGSFNTKQSYVGGISGIGGKFINALNTGEITANAKDQKIDDTDITIEKDMTRFFNSRKCTIYYTYANFTKSAYASGISNKAISVEESYNVSKTDETNIFGGYDSLTKVYKIYSETEANLGLAIGVAVGVAVVLGILVVLAVPVTIPGLSIVLPNMACLGVSGVLLSGVIAGAGTYSAQSYLSGQYGRIDSYVELVRYSDDEEGSMLWKGRDYCNIKNYLTDYLIKGENVNAYKVYYDEKNGKLQIGTLYSDPISYSVNTKFNTYSNNLSNFMPLKIYEYEALDKSFKTSDLSDVHKYNNSFNCYSLDNTNYKEIEAKSNNVNQKIEEPYFDENTQTYIIENANHFYWFIKNPNGKFELKNNIILNGIVDSINEFSGEFNGNHFSIFNLNLNNSGLFKKLSGATIKNLTIKLSTLYANNTDNTVQVGLLANNAENSTINNVEIMDSRMTVINANRVGGLIGTTTKTTISDCLVSTDINAYTDKSKIGTDDSLIASGIVGYSSHNDKIENNTYSGNIIVQVMTTEDISSCDITVIGSGVTAFEDEPTSLVNNKNYGTVVVGTRNVKRYNPTYNFIPTTKSYAYTLYKGASNVFNNNAVAYRTESFEISKPINKDKINLESITFKTKYDFSINGTEYYLSEDDGTLKLYTSGSVQTLIENNAFIIGEITYTFDKDDNKITNNNNEDIIYPYVMNRFEYNGEEYFKDDKYCYKLDVAGFNYRYAINNNSIDLNNYSKIKGLESGNYLIENVSYKKTQNNTFAMSNNTQQNYTAYEKVTDLYYVNAKSIPIKKANTDNEGNVTYENVTYNSKQVYQNIYIAQKYTLTEYYDINLQNKSEISLKKNNEIIEKWNITTDALYEEKYLHSPYYQLTTVNFILDIHEANSYSIISRDSEFNLDTVEENELGYYYLVNNNNSEIDNTQIAIIDESTQSNKLNNFYLEATENLNSAFNQYATKQHSTGENIYDTWLNSVDKIIFSFENSLFTVNEYYTETYCMSHKITENESVSYDLLENGESKPSDKQHINKIHGLKLLKICTPKTNEGSNYLTFEQLKEKEQYKEAIQHINSSYSITKNNIYEIISITNDSINYYDIIYKNELNSSGNYEYQLYGLEMYSIVLLDDKQDLNSGSFFIDNYSYISLNTDMLYLIESIVNKQGYNYMYSVRNKYVIRYFEKITFDENGNYSISTLSENKEYFDDETSDWTKLSQNYITNQEGNIYYYFNGRSMYVNNNNIEIIRNVNKTYTLKIDGESYNLVFKDDCYVAKISDEQVFKCEIELDTYGDIASVTILE